MNVARTTARSTLARSARPSRVANCPVRVRFQSSSSSPSSSSTSSASANPNSHYVAGAVGGLVGGLALYAIFLMTPSGKMHRAINKGAKEINQKYNEAAKKLQGQTPDVDGATRYMKELAYSYVAWVPGGRQYVDTAFKDIETLKQNHRDEVNQIINDAYKQFQDLSKSGFSMETASKAYNVITDMTKKLGDLAGDAFGDILQNHPQLKEKFGGSIDQLKQMGDNYGPEAKKQVDQTWSQAKEILGGGISVANIDKIRRLIEEKMEQVKKLGDEAWNKAQEEAKPYLDKNPKVKELIEKNASSLKQGNAKKLFEQAKKAVDSGDLSSLEDYVNKAKSKGSEAASSMGIDQYFKMIPSGSEILSKVSQLKEVAEKHKDEGEKLLKETMEELKQVLEKKSQKASDIAEKAKKDSTK
ncbi:hypothetical protein F5Y16DRAFT_381538 [Xylariaceae sp. FL0255]|nr:hypothetical protein F5Y16DRAFT_381538 [Xylariaceae sp. FL0255]